MTPLEQAIRVITEEPSQFSFTELLAAHLEHGVVFSTPRVFVLARPVFLDFTMPMESVGPDPEGIVIENTAQILNPRTTWAEDWNAWHAYLVAGDLRLAMDLMPFRLPYLSFERRNKLRAYSTDRMARLTFNT